ncbi:MAG: malonyl CoA-ACP transacylase [acyl-carrier-protein] S-malonyltransferase [Candidatus Dadabacteria bacterium CSP1-2]|nr:MAG: malonyl CoA-ACP transacylase [acyl-carrier-protein] S-malonyltransferase [Candidatus Dadabacteria bacterium CSP1-2]
MKAFVFPGQGSQYVGMGQDLYKEFPTARRTFEESSEVLGLDMAKLCFEGDSKDLRLTENTQPAILTVSVAAWLVLDEETGIKADFLAGHSLGEYSALVASGGLDFRDAVLVVRKRGEYMQAAVPDGVGAMAAILGLSKEKVEEACREASQDGLIVSPANFNAPGQVVISGNKEAVEEACALAKSNGAKRAVLLEVSAPFHCALMNTVAKRLEEVLSQVDIFELEVPVVSNYEAKPNKDSSRVKTLLIDQVANPVRWDDSVNMLYESGVREYVEIGPGNVLSGLIKRTVSNISVLNFEKIEQLKSLKERWKTLKL